MWRWIVRLLAACLILGLLAVVLDFSGIGGVQKMGTSVTADAPSAVVTTVGDIIESGANMPRDFTSHDKDRRQWRNEIPDRWDAA